MPQWFTNNSGKFLPGFEGTREKIENATGMGIPDVDKIDMGQIQDLLGQGIGGNFGTVISEFKAPQRAFINALMGQMNGSGPSVAALQAQQQGQAGLNQLMAMQASQRGVNPALAARNTQAQAAGLNAQIAQSSAMARAQEMLNTQGILGQALGQFRGQDQARNQFNKNMDFQQSFANMQNRQGLGQALLEELLQKRALQSNQNISQAQIRAKTTNEALKGVKKSSEQIPGMMSGLMTMSDRRGKFDIADITEADVKEFVAAAKPQTYKYLNPDLPTTQPGVRAGFMLQDVMDTKLGKLIVRETPDGTLLYDRDNFNGVMLAVAHYAFGGAA